MVNRPVSSDRDEMSDGRYKRFATQGGFSLVELLVSMLIAALVIGVTVGALDVTRRANESSKQNLTSSNSVFQTGSRFGADVASVGPVDGVAQLVATGQPGCGGESSVLRLIGPGADGTGVQVRSYHKETEGSNHVLVRRSCVGSDLTAALAASSVSVNVVVTDLSTEADAVVVGCDGVAVSSSCQVVEMTVKTATDRTFTVRGTIASVLEPTPTTTPLPVVAPVTGTCTIMASETTWGGTGGQAGSGNGGGGDALMYTYNDTNQRISFLRFDLTQPCAEGAAGDWLTLPGGRNLTSVTLYLAYMGKSGGGCCGISKDNQILQPLNDTSTWTEATLTGSNMPKNGARSGYDYKFNVSSSGSLKAHTSGVITNAVKQWYQAGGWVNNGWMLKRDGVGDTLGKLNSFASRHSGNAALRPKLVITWGP